MLMGLASGLGRGHKQVVWPGGPAARLFVPLRYVSWVWCLRANQLWSSWS